MATAPGSLCSTTLGIENQSIALEYALPVIDEIRNLAVNGLNMFAHGGLEVGGVLYGVREKDTVRVLASAELVSEHALGPAFALSPRDLSALMDLMKPPPGLETVGWFRSHTRSGVKLDERDRTLFEQFSINGCHVALVMKPSPRGSATGAFFARTADGAILDSEPKEFGAKHWPVPKEPDLLQPDEPSPVPSPSTEGEDVAQVSAPSNANSEAEPRSRSGSRVWWIGTAAAAILLSALLYGRTLAPQRLALVADSVSPGHVRIRWNHRSALVARAATGRLEIRDGDSLLTVPLDGDQLHHSSIFYTHRSSDLLIKMRVEGSAPGSSPVEETVRFRPPPGNPVAAGPPPHAEAPAPQAPPAAAPVQSQTAKAGDVIYVDGRSAGDTPRAESSTTPSAAEPMDTKPAAPRRTLVVPPQVASIRPQPTLSAPPSVSFATSQSALPDLLSGPAAVVAPPKAVMPPPAAVAPPPRKVGYSGPRSGRLIWTGSLSRRGVVEIDGTQASIGLLAGALPGQPVTVTISPAEFSGNGLIVYSSDRARAGSTEPPSAGNGWNATQFRLAPERSQELVVLEAPAPVNDFKRLVLRNDAKQCFVIVIDWTLR